VNKNFLPEERVVWRKRFHAEYFDFRGKSLFTRFDDCEFVKCTLLIDRDTAPRSDDRLMLSGLFYSEACRCSFRLIGIDEEGTLAQLKALRKTLFDPAIAEHHGRIAKNTGDGALVEFASVVDAVRCADEIQRSMAERNIDVR
jgi:hypothetical protein